MYYQFPLRIPASFDLNRHKKNKNDHLESLPNPLPNACSNTRTLEQSFVEPVKRRVLHTERRRLTTACRRGISSGSSDTVDSLDAANGVRPRSEIQPRYSTMSSAVHARNGIHRCSGLVDLLSKHCSQLRRSRRIKGKYWCRGV